MRRFIFGLIASLGLSTLQAQQVERSITVKTEAGDEVIDLPEGLVSNTDSLYLDWISKNYINLNDNCIPTSAGPTVSDEVYMDRLKRIPAEVEMPFNSIVREFINMYVTRLRQKVAFMLSANNLYMPIIEEALDLYNLPLELKYLPIIESGMNPAATSRQGAVGLWQFMLTTGKLYGLKNTSWIDERRDPQKSARAAARYLKDLYDIYHDWNLVLAAYNCGPGTINKAIRRAGGEKDFWALYNYLPKETRGYVPAFIAANYIMTYYCEHNISPLKMNMPESTDTIHINRPLNLQQVAAVCKMNIAQLRALNPIYKKDFIPGNEQPYPLRLPANMISYFIDHQDEIYNYKASQYITRRDVVSVSAASGRASSQSSSKSSALKAKYHKVRSGDTLSGIASKYGVSVSSLRRLNGIKGNNIRVGRSIRVK